MIYGTFKIYYIFVCIILQLNQSHAAVKDKPCLFQSVSSIEGYSEQKFSALDKNGIQWSCEEYSLSTSSDNCLLGFRRNFTNLVFLMSPFLENNQSHKNGSFIVNWNFDVTESDNSTLGFFLNIRDIIKRKRYCRVFLFKNNILVKKPTQINFQTIIDRAGKAMITTLTPIVDKTYDTRRWNDGYFVPRLNNPSLLEVYFKTRDNIANYSVDLLVYPSNETICRQKYVTKSSFIFKNISSGKYFFLVTQKDPQPNGQCVCYTGRPRFRTCDRCNSVRSPIYEYPQYDKHEPGGSTTEWVWPVVGSVLTVLCIVIVAVIVCIVLRRKHILKFRSQKNCDRYSVMYVIYTADHSPHVTVIEHLINYLRSYCHCEILRSPESQMETRINTLEQLHYIEKSIARSDIILVISSNGLNDLFKLHINEVNSGPSNNYNRTPEYAVEALLHTICLQKAGKLKAKIVGINLPHAPNLESCFESLMVDASFCLPGEATDFLNSIPNSSNDSESVEHYKAFVNNLKDNIADAEKFERSNKEWKGNYETENSDSGFFDHSKLDPCHINTQLSVSIDEDILTQNYENFRSNYYENTDNSVVNFVEPEYRSDLETGSASFSEKMQSINDRYDLATGKRKLDLISIGGLSV